MANVVVMFINIWLHSAEVLEHSAEGNKDLEGDGKKSKEDIEARWKRSENALFFLGAICTASSVPGMLRKSEQDDGNWTNNKNVFSHQARLIHAAKVHYLKHGMLNCKAEHGSSNVTGKMESAELRR